MITTSHFVWAELRSEVFSDLYVKVNKYLYENNIENIVSFQNILSLHVTFYYFENKLDHKMHESIKSLIKDIDLNFEIFPGSFKYFETNNEKKIWYFYWNSDIDLVLIKKLFHNHFKNNDVYYNNLDFIPHITFLRILDYTAYEIHKSGIESIINTELSNLKDKNIFTNNIFLYKVNSEFPGEIQIKS